VVDLEQNFPPWEKHFHMQWTLVFYENISGAGLSVVIENHPLHSGFLKA
jgi:hypothetical protein